MQRDRLTPQSSKPVQPQAFTTQLHASGSDRVNSHTTNPHEPHPFTTEGNAYDPEKLTDGHREGSVTDRALNSNSVIQDVAFAMDSRTTGVHRDPGKHESWR